jgi:hypothetical protein
MSHPGSTKTRGPRPRHRTHAPSTPGCRAQQPLRAATHFQALRIAPLLDAGPITPAQKQALWSLTLPARIQAMYDGQLSLAQLTHWSSHKPDQIPRIGGEFAYLAMREPGWCEPSSPAKEIAA